jgi:hypothetical protein
MNKNIVVLEDKFFIQGSCTFFSVISPSICFDDQLSTENAADQAKTKGC